MTSLTLPRRCLWGNLHGLCEAPWDHLRPPMFFLPTLIFYVVVTPSGLLRA